MRTELSTETTITYNHKVKLTGLTPDPKYYYSIGTLAGVQAGGSEDYSFITARSLPTRHSPLILNLFKMADDFGNRPSLSDRTLGRMRGIAIKNLGN